MSHPIVHIEFSARNHAELAQWYADQFGWKVGSMGPQPYSTAAWSDEPGMGAGFNQVSDSVAPGTVVAYIMVDDIDAQMASIRNAGGEILSPRVETPTVGAWCWFKDPTGNTVGLLQPEMTP